MNILTFDIEEWFLEKRFGEADAHNYQIYHNILDYILNLLKETGNSATFFCLGRMAIEFPEIIQEINEAGFEIGCHSHEHKWINKMSREEFLTDTKAAVTALRSCTGQAINSFRAPAFSIGETNKWAIEVLKECGFENDASIFPAARDFGGFPNFKSDRPCILKYNEASIVEFPIPLLKLPFLNGGLAYSGGGYFRLMPLWLIKNRLEKRKYNMCYFHIADMIPQSGKMMSRQDYETYFKEPGTLKARTLRFIKSNIGRSSAIPKFDYLMRHYKFISIQEARKNMGQLPLIEI